VHFSNKEEIRERIVKGNKVFCANKTVFKSNLVSRKSKLKLSWSVIRPIVVYSCETWVLEESIIQRLSVFERKILRKIFGPAKDSGIWRIKTNKEFDGLIKHRNKINYVKAQRLSWFGYINIMAESSIVKKKYKWKPFTRRPVGRPKFRWEDDVNKKQNNRSYCSESVQFNAYRKCSGAQGKDTLRKARQRYSPKSIGAD
jgi:hypothetical protein